MTRYRITFENDAGHSVAGSHFEAKDDYEAPSRGKALLPAQTAGYEIWRGEGRHPGPLIFAEWTLTTASAAK
jgi:hypothetical protein